MEDSVFTKIIKGEIPCHKIFEDQKVIAFLDINPISPGHTLVVPKEQIDHLWDLDNELYHHTMNIAKQIAKRQREVLQPKRVGMALEGFEVPHAHVHVFPLEQGLEATMIQHAREPRVEPDHERLAEMAKMLSLL